MALAIGPAKRPPVTAASARGLHVGERDGDRVLRGVGGSERDDPGVGQVGLRLDAELGGAGLGGDGDPALESDAAARGAALGDADHELR